MITFLFLQQHESASRFLEEQALKIMNFYIEHSKFLVRSSSDKGFEGTVVNRTLHSINEMSLEITSKYLHSGNCS